jgi:hypothetical protein
VARTPDTRRGEAFRRWLRGLPRTTRRLVVGGIVLGWLALWYGVLLAVERAIGDDDVGWADPLSSMIGPLVGVALAFWLRRRAIGSSGHVWEFDRAVRRRRLPDDADPAEWGPLLDKGDRFQRRARTFALGVTLLVLIATVLLLAWGGYGWGAVVAAALIGAALVAVLEFASRRQSQRIDLLREQLRGLPDRGALTPGD